MLLPVFTDTLPFDFLNETDVNSGNLLGLMLEVTVTSSIYCVTVLKSETEGDEEGINIDVSCEIVEYFGRGKFFVKLSIFAGQ